MEEQEQTMQSKPETYIYYILHSGQLLHQNSIRNLINHAHYSMSNFPHMPQKFFLKMLMRINPSVHFEVHTTLHTNAYSNCVRRTDCHKHKYTRHHTSRCPGGVSMCTYYNMVSYHTDDTHVPALHELRSRAPTSSKPVHTAHYITYGECIAY